MILEVVFGVAFGAAILDNFRLHRKLSPPKTSINVIDGLVLPSPHDDWKFQERKDVVGKSNSTLYIGQIGIHLGIMKAWVGDGRIGYIDGSEKYAAAVLAAYRQRLALRTIEGGDSGDPGS